ncbi:hypothetical protein Aperf_G00000083663 [Anoplocephala perfoliata]
MVDQSKYSTNHSIDQNFDNLDSETADSEECLLFDTIDDTHLNESKAWRRIKPSDCFDSNKSEGNSSVDRNNKVSTDGNRPIKMDFQGPENEVWFRSKLGKRKNKSSFDSSNSNNVSSRVTEDGRSSPINITKKSISDKNKREKSPLPATMLSEYVMNDGQKTILTQWSPTDSEENSSMYGNNRDSTFEKKANKTKVQGPEDDICFPSRLGNKVNKPNLPNSIVSKVNEGTQFAGHQILGEYKPNSTDKCSSEEMSLLKVQRVDNLCQQLREEIVHEINNQLKASLEIAVEKVLERSEADNLMLESNLLKAHMSDKAQLLSKSDKWLPEKKFHHRNSVLTDLFKNSHIKSVQNIFIAVLLIFALNTILYDVVEKGNLAHVYHFNTVTWCFTGLFSAFQCWLMMFLSTSLLVYMAFITWASNRRPVSKSTNFDRIFATLYIAYQMAFLILPVVIVIKYDLAPASTAIVSFEQVRLLMKSHAFVRANSEVALLSGEACEKEKAKRRRQHFQNSEECFPISPCSRNSGAAANDFEITMSNGVPIPSFSHYLYFLFAPTLLYRCSYPRTPYVRWRIVAVNLKEMFLCVVYTYFIFCRFCFAYFDNFGRSAQFNFSPRQLIISAFGCVLPGALILFISFYALFHCWFNAFAELLRFGDRLFYKDWWNSTNFGTYYRTWNVVVHDWLYTYIYRDVYALGGRHRRILAQSAVFLLSAFIHEYMLSVIFRFIYPVLFVLFAGVGFALMNFRGESRSWNIFLWTGLFMGMGIMMCLYSMEWYARKNCPPAQGLSDLFVPRSWFCSNQYT